jgi:dTDP-4-dehydrorhamnose 3,5-epimerase
LEIKPLKLKESFEITLKKIGDSRGYFMETYRRELFAEHGIETDWVQENESLSTRKHTIRGLHFQTPPKTQAKLVRVVRGEILDVFVDLREDSPTCGQWDSIVLSEENCKAVFVPRGFAHGFCALSENVVIQYKVDNAYAPECEKVIRWNDPAIGIDWNIVEPFLSQRDAEATFYKDFVSPF